MSFVRAALVLAAPLLILAAARPPVTATAAPEKYFGCPTGYTFQTSGNNARCYLAGTQATADIYCGVGYVKTIDQLSGNRDACQNQMTNVLGNYTCPSGYQSKAQPGPDLCVKQNPPSIIAPNVEKMI